MSWNILHTKEFLAMMELVHDSKADIVCIQEGAKKELKKDKNEIQWFSNAYSKYYPNDYYIKNIEMILPRLIRWRPGSQAWVLCIVCISMDWVWGF